MITVDIKIEEQNQAQKGQLHTFRITLAVFTGLLGMLFLWRQRDFYIYFLSGASVLLGLFFQVLLKPVYKVFNAFGSVMADNNSYFEPAVSSGYYANRFFGQII